MPDAAPVMPRPAEARPQWVWVSVMLATALAIALGAVLLVRLSRAVPAGPDGTTQFSDLSANHVPIGRSVNYDITPPVGGDHYDGTWQNCGIYDAPLTDEYAVHSMEHGAVWVTYQLDLPVDEVRRLQDIVRDAYVEEERYILLSPYEGLEDRVVASAWGRQLRLALVGDPRLPEFLKLFAAGPQSPERFNSCIDAFGEPLD